MARAAFYERDRKIRIGTVEEVAPGPGEVQVKIAYTGICGTDLHIFHGVMDSRVAPSQVMGHEISGTVNAVGEGVTDFQVGQPVTVMPLDPCGECPACKAGHSHICHNLNFMGIDSQGGFQTFWNVPAFTVLPLPESISMQMAALVEPLGVACHDTRLAEVKPGDKVVVIGGGPIGMLVALVARHMGAEVMVSEINTVRLDIAASVGLKTINPLEKDIVAEVNGWTGDAGADIVFEVTASQAGAETMTKIVRTRGLIMIVGIFGKAPVVNLKEILWREMRLRSARVYEREDFERAIKLIDAGALPLDAVVTDVYDLERLGEALEKLESGGASMKILIQCS